MDDKFISLPRVTRDNNNLVQNPAWIPTDSRGAFIKKNKAFFSSVELLSASFILSNKLDFVWHCPIFCSARAIGWLTAAARRTNQRAAAEEPSAIRSTAQKSFNREQREGAERSLAAIFLKQDSMAYMGFLCSKRDLTLHFLISHGLW